MAFCTSNQQLVFLKQSTTLIVGHWFGGNRSKLIVEIAFAESHVTHTMFR